MADEIKRTYISYRDAAAKSAQTEYVDSTPLLAEDGTLLAKGWARRNVFDFDMEKVSKRWRKEWEFYLINNGKYMGLVSIVSIVIGGYINVAVVDIENGKFLESSTVYFFGKNVSFPKKATYPASFPLRRAMQLSK